MNRNNLIGGGCPYPHYDPIMFPDSAPTSYTTVNANRFMQPHTEDQSDATASSIIDVEGMDNHRIYTALRQGDHVMFIVKGVIKTTQDDFKIVLNVRDDNFSEDTKTVELTEFSTARISTDYVIINSTKLWRVEFDVSDKATFELKLKNSAVANSAYQIHSLEEGFIVSRNVS